jgi:hypothetical protein
MGSKFDEIMNIICPLLKDRPDHRLYVTGHSLGGALATLFAFKAAARHPTPFQMPVTCVSVASPKVGDSGFRKAFQVSNFFNKRLLWNYYEQRKRFPSNPDIIFVMNHSSLKKGRNYVTFALPILWTQVSSLNFYCKFCMIIPWFDYFIVFVGNDARCDDVVTMNPPASTLTTLAAFSPAALIYSLYKNDGKHSEVYYHVGVKLKLFGEEEASKSPFKISYSRVSTFTTHQAYVFHQLSSCRSTELWSIYLLLGRLEARPV